MLPWKSYSEISTNLETNKGCKQGFLIKHNNREQGFGLNSKISLWNVNQVVIDIILSSKFDVTG